VGISTGADGITEIGECVYRTQIPEPVLLPAAAQTVMEEEGATTVGLIHASDDAYSVSGYEGFKSAIDENPDVEIVADESYLLLDTDYSVQLTRIAQADPDLVFLAAFAEEGFNVVRQARDLGIDQPIVGNRALNSLKLIEDAGDAADGVIVPGVWSAKDASERNQEFIETFRDRFDEEPGDFSVAAYNTLHYVADVLRAAEDARDRASVCESLGEVTEFQYIGSPIKIVDRSGTTDDPTLLQVVDGEFEVYGE
jgi:branched-chain amino acid transport system substrate-binding protein